MQLSFLGTSSGTPTKNRNVTAITLQKNTKRWYLIDCGEATQHQLLHSPLAIRYLAAIFITHVHGDHCYGLPGLLASATLQGRTEPLLLVVPQAIKQWIESTLQLSETRLSYELQYLIIEELSTPLDTPDFQVLPIALSHRVPSYAFRFSEYAPVPTIKLNHDKLVAEGILPGINWGRLQRGEAVTLEDGRILNPSDYCIEVAAPLPRVVIISGDNDTPNLLAPYLDQVQLVVHESTYTQAIADKVGDIPQHTSAKKIAEFAEQYDVPNLILTHFSARYSTDITPIAEEARCYYHGNLLLAEDFNTYQLDTNNQVHLVEEVVNTEVNTLVYE